MSKLKGFLLNRKYFSYYIYLYIFFLPIETFDVQMRVLSTLLLVWWLILGKQEGYFTKLKEILLFKPLVLFFVTLIYFYMSILWSSSIEDGLYITARLYKYYWLIVPILFTSLSLEQAKNAFVVLTLCFISYAIFSFLIYLGFLTGFGNGTTIDNPTGIYKYTVTSHYMIFGVFYSLILFLFSKEFKYKLFYAIGLFFTSFAFLTIDGRNAKLTFILVGILLLIVNFRLFKKMKYLLSGLVVSAIILFSIINTDTYKKFDVGIIQLKSFNIEDNYRGSWRERLFMLQMGIDVFKKNPYFGAGGDDNIKYFHDYVDKHNLTIPKYWNLHNLYIEYLSKYGIVGSLIFLSSVIFLLYSLRNEKLFFQLAVAYFGTFIVAGIGVPLNYSEPHSDLYALTFVLFAIIAYNSKCQTLLNKEEKH